MNKRVEAVIEAASKLSTLEQLLVARRIIDSAKPLDPEIDERWLRIAREQMAAYDRGELETYDAEEVIAELRAKSRARPTKTRALR